MNRKFLTLTFCLALAGWLASTPVAWAAAPIRLEVATEQGLQITAPREWLQLLTTVGVSDVQIRSATRGEEPSLDNRGTEDRPRYHVVAVLTSRQQLRLPGGTFGRSDRAKLRDYFESLAADGAAGVTAAKGRYGLTERQFRALHADLSQPVSFETKALSPLEVVENLGRQLQHEVDYQHSARQVLQAAEPSGDELAGFTAGTALAIALRSEQMALKPEKPRGGEVVLRVVALSAAELEEDREKQAENTWPAGWETDARPRELAPALFESVNAQIAGYSLQEALDAIGPRIKVPTLLDHAALQSHRIDVDKLQVQFPAQRTYYKRVLDRILFQARLHGELRVDEGGKVFYWISR